MGDLTCNHFTLIKPSGYFRYIDHEEIVNTCISTDTVLENIKCPLGEADVEFSSDLEFYNKKIKNLERFLEQRHLIDKFPNKEKELLLLKGLKYLTLRKLNMINSTKGVKLYSSEE